MTRIPSPAPAQVASVIRASNLFDVAYYKSHFALEWDGIDPVDHFMRTWRDHFVSPSADFDICKYLGAYPDVYSSRLNPLYHFLTCAKIECKRKWRVDEEFDKNSIFTSLSIKGSYLTKSKSDHNRIVIFAAYDEDFIIRDSTIHLLEELRSISDTIIFISDNYFPISELLKISHLIKYYECRKFGERDFGLIKRGLEIIERYNSSQKYNEIVICNDSIYGPSQRLFDVFTEMDKRNCDFWGLTNNTFYVPEHLQSFFLVFRKTIPAAKLILEFLSTRSLSTDSQHIVRNCEIPLTQYLIDKGYKKSEYLNVKTHPGGTYPALNNYNLTLDPLYTLKAGFPFIKKRPLVEPLILNRSGLLETLDWLRKKVTFLYNIIRAERPELAKPYEHRPFFSVILATWNREKLVTKAIDSLLAQTYQNFELIIVDDGSTDNTQDLITTQYGNELRSGKIVYKKLDQNGGVCRARNAGLKAARYEWICYLDSDNTVHKLYLEYFALAINQNPDNKCFYSRFLVPERGITKGKPYDRDALLRANFIDLGVFCHHRMLVEKLGGFDENMQRLVDYELIIRYTSEFPPAYITFPLMHYNDGQHERITNTEHFGLNEKYIAKKHLPGIHVVTFILCTKYTPGLNGTIECAIQQQGDFAHHVILLMMRGLNSSLLSLAAKCQAKYSTLLDIHEVDEITMDTLRTFCPSAATYLSILQAGDLWTARNRWQSIIDCFGNEGNTDLILTNATLTAKPGQSRNLWAVSRARSRGSTSQDGVAELGQSLLSAMAIRAQALYSLDFAGAVQDNLFSALLAKYSGVMGSIDKIFAIIHPQPAAPATDILSAKAPSLKNFSPRSHIETGAHHKASIKISIIVAVKAGDNINPLLDSILRNTPRHLDWELVVSASPDWGANSISLPNDTAIRVITTKDPYPRNEARNHGVRMARGGTLVFLDVEAEVQPGWLDALIKELELEPKTGVAGARLVYPDHTLRHCGIGIMGIGLPEYIHAGKPHDFFLARQRRVVCGVSSECMAVRKEEFVKAGWINQNIPPSIADVELGCRYRKLELNCVYCPESLVTIHKPKIIGMPLANAKEMKIVRDRFPDSAQQDDFTFTFTRAQVNKRPLRFALKVNAPNRQAVEWGDIYYAECFAKALAKAGHCCAIHYHNEWNCPDKDIDVVIKISGIDKYTPKPYNVNIIWMISHPELHTKDMLEQYDGICIASRPYARSLQDVLSKPVFPLLQAVDPDVYYPDTSSSPKKYDVVFVGANKGLGRLKVRQMVKHMLSIKDSSPFISRFDIWGTGWEGICGSEIFHGSIQWKKQRDLYVQSSIGLNDHHPTMAVNGFVNDRTYYIIASGIPIISDKVVDLDHLIDIPQCETAAELRDEIRYIKLHHDQTSERFRAARATVLSEFTFKKRVQQLENYLEQLDISELLRSKKIN